MKKKIPKTIDAYALLRTKMIETDPPSIFKEYPSVCITLVFNDGTVQEFVTENPDYVEFHESVSKYEKEYLGGDPITRMDNFTKKPLGKTIISVLPEVKEVYVQDL